MLVLATSGRMITQIHNALLELDENFVSNRPWRDNSRSRDGLSYTFNLVKVRKVPRWKRLFG